MSPSKYQKNNIRLFFITFADLYHFRNIVIKHFTHWLVLPLRPVIWPDVNVGVSGHVEGFYNKKKSCRLIGLENIS